MNASDNSKCILTGSDSTQEWLLPWWYTNVRKHMPHIPIVIADFGLSESFKQKCKNIVQILPVPRTTKLTWFMKPKAILDCPYKYTCWMDTDCEVKKPILDIFHYAKDEKLALTPDPYSYRNKWAYWQTGVVVIKDKPKILKDWTDRSLKGIDRGDQEALYSLIGNSSELVNEMPKEYQWLRLDLKYLGMNSEAKVIHWTGPRGKEKIRSFILALD